MLDGHFVDEFLQHIIFFLQFSYLLVFLLQVLAVTRLQALYDVTVQNLIVKKDGRIVIKRGILCINKLSDKVIKIKTILLLKIFVY